MPCCRWRQGLLSGICPLLTKQHHDTCLQTSQQSCGRPTSVPSAHSQASWGPGYSILPWPSSWSPMRHTPGETRVTWHRVQMFRPSRELNGGVGQTGLLTSIAVFSKKLKIVSTAVKHFADRSRMVFVSCLLHRSEAVLAETTMWGAQFWWSKFAKSILPAGRSPSSLFTRK